jgi:beclin 1
VSHSAKMAEDKSEKMLISFMCQRCSQPLQLDDSLSSFSEHISAELNLPIHSNPDVDLESQATSFDHYIAPCRLFDSGNGFMLISDGNEVDSLSHIYKRKAALFDTLSGNSNIDHPLCDECTDYLIEILEQELADTQNDYDDYLRYYKMLQNDTNELKIGELEKELDDLKAEGNRFLEELEALKKEEIELQNAIEEQESVARRLDRERQIYYKEYTKHQKNYMQACEDAQSLECQLNYTQMQLDKLKKTNVFNATFHIWHKGHFGTINNFCLGRLPSAPIDWSEINAAWGQTALLLSALARKINLTFERYRLVPYGNHSYIEVQHCNSFMSFINICIFIRLLVNKRSIHCMDLVDSSFFGIQSLIMEWPLFWIVCNNSKRKSRNWKRATSNSVFLTEQIKEKLRIMMQATL